MAVMIGLSVTSGYSSRWLRTDGFAARREHRAPLRATGPFMNTALFGKRLEAAQIQNGCQRMCHAPKGQALCDEMQLYGAKRHF